MMHRTDPELKAAAICVLREYKNTGRVNLSLFLSTLNKYEAQNNIDATSLEQLIANAKSKYHLLFSLSNAHTFKAELLPTQMINDRIAFSITTNREVAEAVEKQIEWDIRMNSNRNMMVHSVTHDKGFSIIYIKSINGKEIESKDIFWVGNFCKHFFKKILA